MKKIRIWVLMLSLVMALGSFTLNSPVSLAQSVPGQTQPSDGTPPGTELPLAFPITMMTNILLNMKF